MATNLSFGPVGVQWPWDYENVVVPANTKSVSLWNYTTPALTQGTAAGNADTLYTSQTSLALSTSTQIVLNAVTNAFGTSVAFARLKAMYFENSSLGLSASVLIGGAASTPFTGGFFDAGTDTLTLRNGVHLSVGVVQDATGYVVSTGINLKINNTDGTNAAKVNIGLVGASV